VRRSLARARRGRSGAAAAARPPRRRRRIGGSSPPTPPGADYNTDMQTSTAHRVVPGVRGETTIRLVYDPRPRFFVSFRPPSFLLLLHPPAPTLGRRSQRRGPQPRRFRAARVQAEDWRGGKTYTGGSASAWPGRKMIAPHSHINPFASTGRRVGRVASI
jgi:hypothetical protein